MEGVLARVALAGGVVELGAEQLLRRRDRPAGLEGPAVDQVAAGRRHADREIVGRRRLPVPGVLDTAGLRDPQFHGQRGQRLSHLDGQIVLRPVDDAVRVDGGARRDRPVRRRCHRMPGRGRAGGGLLLRQIESMPQDHTGALAEGQLCQSGQDVKPRGQVRLVRALGTARPQQPDAAALADRPAGAIARHVRHDAAGVGDGVIRRAQAIPAVSEREHGVRGEIVRPVRLAGQ